MPLTPKHAARILDLDETATLSDLRAARRRLVFAYHPDRFEDAEDADRHMARINAAYDTFLAHLKGQPLPAFDYNFSDGTNFRKPKPSRQANPNTRPQSAGPKTAHRKTPRPQKHRRATPQVIAISVEAPHVHASMTAACPAKVRSACSSYAKVLNDIGGPSFEPAIDTKVLRVGA